MADIDDDVTATPVEQKDATKLKGTVKVTDGTNFMPTMDIAARKGFVRPTDGTNNMPMMDNAARPGYVRITDGVDSVDGIYDYITNKFSIATSRGVGKATFTEVYANSIEPTSIIIPSVGKSLLIAGILTTSESNMGILTMDMMPEALPVWRHYIDMFKSLSSMDMAVIGNPDGALQLTIEGATGESFVLINYREVDWY